MKKISLLGSTGSIGTQSLDVCEMHGYDVKCLTANSKVDIMEEQIRKFKPDMVCMMSETAAKELKAKISDTNTKVVCGMEGLIECATYDKADTVLNSVVGMVGLQPTLEAIKAKKTLALANKETLVAGGHLVTNLAKEKCPKDVSISTSHWNLSLTANLILFNISSISTPCASSGNGSKPSISMPKFCFKNSSRVTLI
jgi:1-deoxy-D-xylulose-5-phosphate reductoisomerase